MLKPFIAKAINTIHLTADEAEQAMTIIMTGQATPAQTEGDARTEDDPGFPGEFVTDGLEGDPSGGAEACESQSRHHEIGRAHV